MWSHLPSPTAGRQVPSAQGNKEGPFVPFKAGCSDLLYSTAESPSSLPVKHSPHTRPTLLSWDPPHCQHSSPKTGMTTATAHWGKSNIYVPGSPEGSAMATLTQLDSTAGVGPKFHREGPPCRDDPLPPPLPLRAGRGQALICLDISAADTGKQVGGRAPRKGVVYRWGTGGGGGADVWWPCLCVGCGSEQATAGACMGGH